MTAVMESDDAMMVLVDDPTVVVVSESGPGPQGPAGPAGPAGADATHVHVQAIAAATWVIDHALNKRPSVTTVDSAGTVVFGGISYPSATQVVIQFLAPFGGEAYLN